MHPFHKGRLITLFGLLLTSLHQISGVGFNHSVMVKHDCLSEAKICEFELRIEQRRNMAIYGRPKDSKLARDNARLLELKDGELFINDNSNCGELTRATETDINNAITSDGEDGFVYTINGQYPGPTLTVYEGQEVAVKVTNLLCQESLTLHWHGMRQHKTNWMDGVPTVTQCAIAPQQSFQYRFFAYPAGSHWYHSHQGAQRTDGMYGALVVLPRPENQQMSNLGNSVNQTANTMDKDYILLVQDKYPKQSKAEYHNFYNGISQGPSLCDKPAVQADGTNIGSLEYYSAVVNGRGYPLSQPIPGLPLERFDVQYGSKCRFRLINAGLLYTFKFSIDGHKLSVVASDGYALEPQSADALYISPGERYDVMVEANVAFKSFWIRLETLHWNLTTQEPIPQSVLAILDYGEQQSPASTAQCNKDHACAHINCPFKEFPRVQGISCRNLDGLKSNYKSHIKGTTDRTVFLNFHFANATDGGIRSAINGIQHLRSSVSTNTQPMSFEQSCDQNLCADGRPCRCTNQLNLTTNSVVQMVFFSQMWDGSTLIGSAHPVHMHGHHFEVLKVGYPEIDPDTKVYKAMSQDIVCNNDACNSASWIKSVRVSPTQGMNHVNPPVKDTVLVPAGGYVVVRYVTDNPGFWMLHSQTENHNLEGMALIVKEGDYKEMNPPPSNFPKCGSFHLSEKDFRDSLDGNHVHRYRGIYFIFTVVLSVVSGVLCVLLLILVIYTCSKKKTQPRHEQADRRRAILDDASLCHMNPAGEDMEHSGASAHTEGVVESDHDCLDSSSGETRPLTP